MSRPVKLIMCAAALSAGGGAALAAAAPGSAPARGDSRMIVCPLEPSATVTFPCCGPPIVTAASSYVVPCCDAPEPINCPVGLTLSSSPKPSTAGQKVTITGRWPGNTAGQTVDLWQQLAAAKTFTDVAHTTTGSLGDFQFVRKGVETNRKWYVTVGSSRSVTVTQQVRAVVKLIGLHGQVVPNHAGERMLIEDKAASGWAVIARPRVSPASTFSFGPADGEVRAVFRGDRRNIRSVSQAVVLHG